jgi:hypothetical protein
MNTSGPLKYTVTERGDGSGSGSRILSLMFAAPVDQEDDSEVDGANAQIRRDLNLPTDTDQIDWRDDQECWIHPVR